MFALRYEVIRNDGGAGICLMWSLVEGILR